MQIVRRAKDITLLLLGIFMDHDVVYLPTKVLVMFVRFGFIARFREFTSSGVFSHFLYSLETSALTWFITVMPGNLS